MECIHFTMVNHPTVTVGTRSEAVAFFPAVTRWNSGLSYAVDPGHVRSQSPVL